MVSPSALGGALFLIGNLPAATLMTNASTLHTSVLR